MGKGSFGQVVKSLDHLTKEEIALKMVRNEKRFHRQVGGERVVLVVGWVVLGERGWFDGDVMGGLVVRWVVWW